MPRRSAFKLFGPRGAPLIRQSRKPFRIAQLYHIGNISVKQHFKLNNVLQFFEPANNIRGEAMIAAGAGIGVFPKRSGSVWHIAEKSDNIFENILLIACPH